MRVSSRFVLLACVATHVARADIAPPPGYVEACTVEKQKKGAEECVSCGTFFAEPDKCLKEHGRRGFSFRCKTRGGSTWAEVWCKDASRTVVTSLGDPPEAGTLGPSDAGATSPAKSAPTTSAAPSPSPSPSPNPVRTGDPAVPPSSPAPSASPQSPSKRGSELPPAEKRGGCGACRLGGHASDPSAPAIFVIGAVAWAARRRFSQR